MLMSVGDEAHDGGAIMRWLFGIEGVMNAADEGRGAEVGNMLIQCLTGTLQADWGGMTCDLRERPYWRRVWILQECSTRTD